ncbi:MAG TPA: type II toxin-antitoxin system RelE/ParE family toxin [Gemmatales bacterium]|nr:type II toxin-antitoxin system RelE/ParE family toxin [Gemmatales bacterium]
MLPGFTKAWRKLKIGKPAFELLLTDLTDDAEAGDVIPGSDGLRKLRIKLPGRGKRGGGRVIYALYRRRTRILLAAVYSKSEREDLSQDELDTLRQALRELDG